MAYLQDYSWNDRRRGLKGMGFIAPAALAIAGGSGPVAPIVLGAAAVFSALLAARAMIGRGHREADIITPVQNQVGARLKFINDNINSVGVEQLQAWINELQEIQAKFVNFTFDPGFTDKRASTQARLTICPLIDGTDGEGNIIRQDGGTIGTIVRRIYELTGQQYPGPALTQGGPAALRYPGNLPILPQAGLLPSGGVPGIWPTLTGGPGPANAGGIEQLTAGGGFDLTTMLMLGAMVFFVLRK